MWNWVNQKLKNTKILKTPQTLSRSGFPKVVDVRDKAGIPKMIQTCYMQKGTMISNQLNFMERFLCLASYRCLPFSPDIPLFWVCMGID